MKKILILFLFMYLIFDFGYTFAHPGRTDSSGCHTCRTNCSSRGLKTGEYHCHNSKGTSQSLPQVTSSKKTNTTYYENTNQIYSTNTNLNMDFVCSYKYPGTVYRESDDKCVCPGNNPDSRNNILKKCLTLEEQLNNLNNTEYSLKDIQCNSKYPGTIYRKSDDKCVCPGNNPDSWNLLTNSCNNEKVLMDKQCNNKYPGTIYRESDDSCICPGNNPFGWNTKTRICE